MNQEKFLKLQRQMRHNNDEYQNFLNDIESWSDDLKLKDEQLKSSDTNKCIPQIRNSGNKKPKIKQPKIKSYDYQSWDKFDVDKALQDFDENDDIKTIHKLNLENSIKLKEIGNDYFKKGDYLTAVEKYSEAISFDRNNDVLFTNRAMAHIKLGNYNAGETDCSQAIDINNKSVKALYRRAKCRLFLNLKDQALVDFKTVLKLEPDNKLAFKEMKDLEKDLNTMGIVEPLYKPIKDRISTKPLKRIEIIDVNPNKSFEQQLEIKQLENMAGKQTEECIKPIESQFHDVVNQSSETKMEFRVPKTALQLSKDLSSYRANSNHLARYLVGINCGNYSTLIGQQLDSDLLLDLINGLSWAVKLDLLSHDKFVESFNQLSRVSRFSFLWPMISNAEKVHFNDVVSFLNIDTRNKLLNVF